MRFQPQKHMNVSSTFLLISTAQCSCCKEIVWVEEFYEIVDNGGYSAKHPLGDGFCTKCCKNIEEADERVRNWVPPPPPSRY